jgi:oligoribonuclease NrnB/cAMP/cGMP phosphodiesterase (DHH superfamily)
MLYAIEKAKKVIWLDHHKTSVELLEGIKDPQTGNLFHNVDTSYCGAILTWGYFMEGVPTPDLLYYIDDYDRWKFEYPETKPINKALYSQQPWEFIQWNKYAKSTEWLRRLVEEGETLLRAHDQNVKKIVESAAMPCRIFKNTLGLAANCSPMFSSDVGHELAVKSGTFGMAWFMNKKRECVCQLRSNGDYDVSTIAEFFGGGGHLNAAGFSATLEQLSNWIKP